MEMLSSILIQILNMSITAAYVIIAVLLARLLIKGLPKKYSYILWGIVGLRLLFPFSIESGFSLFNLDFFKTVPGKAQQDIASHGMAYLSPQIGYEAQPEIDTGIGAVNEAINQLLPPASPHTSVNPLQIYLYLGGLIWVGGILLLLLYMLISRLRLDREVKCAVLCSEGRWGTVYECDRIGSPFVKGILNPRIYIPFHLEGREREYILAHEAYHIRRNDVFIKTGAYLLVCVYWFHPLVWLAYFLMIRDMEMSCDEAVLKQYGGEIKQDYSRFLLAFAVQKAGLVRSPGLLAPLAFGESVAGRRIKNVLKFKRPVWWAGGLGAAFLVILAVVCLTDRENTNRLLMTKGTVNPPFTFGADCRRAFTRDVKSGFLFAEVYDKGEYLGRVPIAPLDFSRLGQKGEGTLSLRSDVNREQHFSFIELAYQEGEDSYSTSQEHQSVWSVQIPFEDSVMTLAFRYGEWEEDSVKYEIRPEEPCMIGIVRVGTGATGWIKILEKMTPKNMMRFGEGSEEFKECVSEKGISMLVYMVISEENIETLEQKYSSQGILEIQEAVQ